MEVFDRLSTALELKASLQVCTLWPPTSQRYQHTKLSASCTVDLAGRNGNMLVKSLLCLLSVAGRLAEVAVSAAGAVAGNGGSAMEDGP